MNVTLQTLPKSEIKLTIKLTEEMMKKFKERAIKDIAKHVKVDGFRPGHAPYEVLKQHIHEDAIISHTLDLALPETYSDAVVKEKIKAVARPKINILQNDPLEYEATVAVYPEVKISGYEKLDIKKNEAKVEEKDIDEVLSDIQKRHAKYQVVDRPAQKGDRVEIDFEGFDEGGVSLESTKSKNHPLIIGEGSLVKGFEDELIGMKADDKKNFKVTFPKDYFHKPFQEKTVEFKVEMKRVEEIILPAWDKDFILTLIGEEKTIEELKEITRENLQRDKEHQEKVRRENEFLEKIIDLTEVDTPKALIEEEIDGMVEEFKNELQERGVSLEKYIEQTKKELKDLREDRRKEAEKRLKLRFGLQQLFQQEKIEVTPEELKQEIEKLINLYPPKEQYKIRKEYEEGQYLAKRLENKTRMEKLFEKFLK